MKRIRVRDPAGSIRDGELVGDDVEVAGRTYSLDEVEVFPPVRPSKVLGVGFNYRSRLEEGESPQRPFVWWKGGRNVVSGHGDTVTLPESGEVVFEAELGVVIGEQCRNVTPDEAMDVVEGFTCVNDLTDLSAQDDSSMFRIKSFDNSAPMGPVVASPDHVSAQPRVQLWIDGNRKQDSAGDEFVFSIREVIASVTERVTLEPEDVILMGNPGDFSPLTDGDRVTIEIEGIGRLEHDVKVGRV